MKNKILFYYRDMKIGKIIITIIVIFIIYYLLNEYDDLSSTFDKIKNKFQFKKNICQPLNNFFNKKDNDINYEHCTSNIDRIFNCDCHSTDNCYANDPNDPIVINSASKPKYNCSHTDDDKQSLNSYAYDILPAAQYDDNITAVFEDYSTSNSAPVQYTDSSTAAEYISASTPVQYTDSSTYIDTNSSTPVQYTDSSTAAEYISASTPVEYTDSSTAAEYISASTPIEYTDSRTATEYIGASTPFQYTDNNTYTNIDNSISTPIENKDNNITSEYSGRSTPVQYTNNDTSTNYSIENSSSLSQEEHTNNIFIITKACIDYLSKVHYNQTADSQIIYNKLNKLKKNLNIHDNYLGNNISIKKSI